MAGNQITKTIYIALSDEDFMLSLAQQLKHYSFDCKFLDSKQALIDCFKKGNLPDALVVDIDFCGKAYSGAELMATIQAEHGTSVPLIFTSSKQPTLETFLHSIKAHSELCAHMPDEMSQVVEKIHHILAEDFDMPYRALMVIASTDESARCEQLLTKGGVKTYAASDPNLAHQALLDSRPDVIVLEINLGSCSGVQLARVFRQQPSLVSVPIIFLTNEAKLQMDYDPIALGGDAIYRFEQCNQSFVNAVYARAERSRQLRELMIKDSLTQLFNHTATIEAFGDTLARGIRTKSPVCFTMLDIDHFKNVNDTYGHATGDVVLQSLARLLRTQLRRSDIVGRYGGEEFAIIMPDTKLSGAVMRLEQLRLEFCQLEYESKGRKFHVSFSAGVVECDELDVDLYKEKADELLYKAKDLGRNQIVS